MNHPNRKVWRFPGAVIAVLLFCFGFFVPAGCTPGRSQQTPAPLMSAGIKPERIWFDDLSPLKVKSEELEPAARAALLSVAKGVPFKKGSLDRGARIVFISVSDGKKRAYIITGRGGDLGLALTDGIKKTRRVIGRGVRPRWVRLDVVDFVVPFRCVGGVMPVSYRQGIHGVALSRAQARAYPPGVVAASHLVWDGRLDLVQADAYEHKMPGRSRKLRQQMGLAGIHLYYFSCRSYFLEGGDFYPLYRNHRKFTLPRPEQVKRAIIMAGDYLAAHTGADGKFDYNYSPHLGRPDGDYNDVRHAGTASSLLELYRVVPKKSYLKAAVRALDYLEARRRQAAFRGKFYRPLTGEGYVSLGTNALGLLALANYRLSTGKTDRDRQLRETARFIMAVQEPDGRFICRMKYPSLADPRYQLAYYPGEAAYALALAHRVTGDPSMLTSAEKGMGWILGEIRKSSGGRRQFSGRQAYFFEDHWHLYALWEIYRATEDKKYLDDGLKITRRVIATQNLAPVVPDWKGSFNVVPQTGTTSTRSEALSAAYRLALKGGRKQDARKIRKSLDQAVAYQLKTQITPPMAMYYNKPGQALGGFRSHFYDDHVRIDIIQHNLSSLVAWWEIFRKGIR